MKELQSLGLNIELNVADDEQILKKREMMGAGALGADATKAGEARL